MKCNLFLLQVVFIALFLQCSNDYTGVGMILDDVESYIEQYPDSALLALQDVNNELLSDEELKARYALLYSMALDKNYIDKTDFSILQPAIDHYEKKGSPTDKLRMYYYQGCIFRNAGDEESAMECYLKGLDYGKDSGDRLTMARTLFAKALIHNKLYEFDKYVVSMLEAAKFFKGKKQSSYFRALSSAHNGYVLLNDTIQAAAILDSLSTVVDYNNPSQIADMYEVKIAHENKFNSGCISLKLIDEYISNVPDKNIAWLSVAATLYKNGKYDDCLEAIRNYERFSKERPDRYYALLSGTHEHLQNHSEALKNYKQYIKLDMSIFKQDTKFMEERYNMQIASLEESRRNQMYVFSLVLIIVALMGLVLFLRNRYRIGSIEKENYILRCAQLENEKYGLEKILEDSGSMMEQMRSVLMGRLAVLNSFMVADIDKTGRAEMRARKELEKLLGNREAFISSTKEIYEVSYPDFIRSLKERQLTDLEISYCCLYAIGLRVKDVGNYMSTSTHYNVNISIRKKLGLDSNATNLDIYIRKILQEL